MTKDKQKAEVLKGWTAIAKFLGQPITVVQRWGTEGMPVTKEGRFVHADPEELTNWVGTESGKRKPVRIASESENLAADLKQALSYVRGHRKGSIRNQQFLIEHRAASHGKRQTGSGARNQTVAGTAVGKERPSPAEGTILRTDQATGDERS